MNFSVLRGLIFLTALLSILSAGNLAKGENRILPLSSHRLNDFHFSKPVVYMDIVNFQTAPSDGKSFKLSKNYTFYSKMKVGKLTISEARKKRAFDYLAHAILKRDYFWKNALPPASVYGFTTLRFMEARDQRLKAITEPQDILDLFGPIDTIAELQVWLEAMYASTEPVEPYSWKRVDRLYRIRYRGVNPFTCEYREYFLFFNELGKKVKTEKIKHYRKKGCAEIMP